MTTSTLDKLAFAYILECIDTDGRELEKEPETDREKLLFLMETFYSEYIKNHKYFLTYYGSYFKGFSEWLKGLPSCFNIVFTNYDIIQLAKKWQSIPENAAEWQEDKIINNYWDFITSKTFKLCKRNKIDVFEIFEGKKVN